MQLGHARRRYGTSSRQPAAPRVRASTGINSSNTLTVLRHYPHELMPRGIHHQVLQRNQTVVMPSAMPPSSSASSSRATASRSGSPVAEHATQAASPNQPFATKSQETLSQFVAKVLDQLSLSAWLPAVAFVFSGALVGSLVGSDGDLPDALSSLASMTWQSLVLLLGAVILVTVLTQAFGFEAIRWLEGYWGSSRIPSRFVDWRCHRHITTRDRLRTRYRELELMAFALARQNMLSSQVPRLTVDILEADVTGTAIPTDSDAEIASARRFGWLGSARPSAVRQLHTMVRRLDDFPVNAYRVLPTHLGNVLRAREEKAYRPAEGDLRGMVQRVFHMLPASMQSEHDQYRTRLDLYCSLVVVFGISTVGAVAALTRFGWKHALTSGVVGVFLIALSYRAAIVSARAYGNMLITMRAALASSETG